MTMKQGLQSLIGKLSFAAKVVPLGRLIELSTTFSKLHHHIHLSVEAREDIMWWNSFLPSWNGVSIFLDPNWKDAEVINLASGTLGYGVYFNEAWFCGDWLPHQKPPMQSIQWQEFFAIVAAACTWGHLLQGQLSPTTSYRCSLFLPHRPTHSQPQYFLSWESSKPSDGEAHQQSTGPIHFQHAPNLHQEVLRFKSHPPTKTTPGHSTNSGTIRDGPVKTGYT